MKDALQPERADLKEDNFGFVDFLAEKEEIFEEVIPLREHLNFKQRNKDHSRRQNKKDLDDQSSCAVAGRCHVEPDPDSSRKQKALPPCLKPKCFEKNLVKD